MKVRYLAITNLCFILNFRLLQETSTALGRVYPEDICGTRSQGANAENGICHYLPQSVPDSLKANVHSD